ncbi:MAG: peptidoglycan recognition protein family protein [Planctomycetota bacterium]|jgi:hypothetical protein
MSVRPRQAKIFVALLISMTAGAIALMVLGNNPPSAGAFCLSRYNHLDPVEEVISSRAAQSPHSWNCIEIYYSATKAGNIEQLVSLSGLACPEDINCHFVVCNGLGGDDGQIQSTEKWQRQWSIIPGQNSYSAGQTIRICVIADGKDTRPTDSQRKRTEALVEQLQRKFDIKPNSIFYPNDWQ